MEEKLLGREEILGLLKSTSLLGEECWLTSGAALVLYGVNHRPGRPAGGRGHTFPPQPFGGYAHICLFGAG